MGHRRTRIRLVGVLVAASATMASGRSQAQDSVTLGASLAGIASSAGEVIGYLQKGYSAYKFLDGLFNPQPSTAQLIQAAVAEMKEFITETSLNETWYPRANTVSSLLSTAQQTNADADWKLFQFEANRYLFDVENAIRNAPQGSGGRYAHALAGIYNIYMPVLMAVHLNGAQHELPLVNNADGKNHAEQVYSLAKRLIQLDYDLVGLKSTIRQSPLWIYIKDHFNGKCFGYDPFCDTFFRTDPVVQAIWKGGAGVYRTFGADPDFPNLNRVMDRNANTITIDPLANWGDNWEGYENAVWNPIYSKRDGNWVKDRRCPVDHAIIGVINLPWCKKIGESRGCFPVMEAGWAQGFLCQKMPQLPPWNAFSTLMQTSQPGVVQQPGGFVSYAYSCNPDFIGGFDNSADDITGFVCRSRKDGNGPKFPTHQLTEGCKVTSTLQSFPYSGLFTPLPANTYLVAGDFTAYQQHDYTYTSCKAQVALGVGAFQDKWRLADIPMIAGFGLRYPLDFSIFVLKDATGLQDVRGPVAAGGNVSARYFSINVDANQAVGLVAGGALDLPTGGTVNGITFVGGAANISPNASMDAPRKLNQANIDAFQVAFTKLQDTSTMLSQLPPTGQAKLEYSTLTLSSADPNFTVFSVSADTLSKTSTIKYAFPATATVVINVVGNAVTMQNMGFQAPSSGYDTKVMKPNRVLWNFPQAKTLFGSSISIPGSVLAPFADVEIRWGALDGTLVASSVKAFYEFHWFPFRSNLLVP